VAGLTKISNHFFNFLWDGSEPFFQLPVGWQWKGSESPDVVFYNRRKKNRILRAVEGSLDAGFVEKVGVS
jgi:hypothetical protein